MPTAHNYSSGYFNTRSCQKQRYLCQKYVRLPTDTAIHPLKVHIQRCSALPTKGCIYVLGAFGKCIVPLRGVEGSDVKRKMAVGAMEKGQGHRVLLVSV